MLFLESHTSRIYIPSAAARVDVLGICEFSLIKNIKPMKTFKNILVYIEPWIENAAPGWKKIISGGLAK
ncbi:hypothetical protein ABK905_17760 [Acerihabitans sp. KWT182]|uniref:Uncharacterized protein n=1 Tax=Acerihabitans sp. KWT182 TaxID=3157919 RepID=A0AAU7Q5W1_9GAMM